MSEEKTIEKIGNITLNLKHYEGTDVYTDGDVEDELLAIVRDLSPVEYPKVIEEILGIQSFYHCGIRNIKKEELQYVKNTCFTPY